jgi:hypothetical protein
MGVPFGSEKKYCTRFDFYKEEASCASPLEQVKKNCETGEEIAGLG